MYCIVKNGNPYKLLNRYVAEFTNRISCHSLSLNRAGMSGVKKKRILGNIIRLGLSTEIRHDSRTEGG